MEQKSSLAWILRLSILAVWLAYAALEIAVISVDGERNKAFGAAAIVIAMLMFYSGIRKPFRRAEASAYAAITVGPFSALAVFVWSFLFPTSCSHYGSSVGVAILIAGMIMTSLFSATAVIRVEMKPKAEGKTTILWVMALGCFLLAGFMLDNAVEHFSWQSCEPYNKHLLQGPVLPIFFLSVAVFAASAFAKIAFLRMRHSK